MMRQSDFGFRGKVYTPMVAWETNKAVEGSVLRRCVVTAFNERGKDVPVLSSEEVRTDERDLFLPRRTHFDRLL